ncbi:uncharacterized protein LOC121265225 isoform X2 [Juglans microcarpa x Juglans regia]|uniref:uncharacterized protein LOC121265225 isoform X2 n=1 Tax=Juglans microcarpa x Juglans regia TaxID=2249226 RepID=UPI001B7E0D39|nr:uncharacterized protein LOC121265225 isoform X2 [Juglans microcarpa x Juglans regia]
MAEFPPNLDDGEVWLPSDIFLNEVVPASCLSHRNLSCVDNLAERFAAFAVLQHRRNVSNAPRNLSPNLEWFRPEVQKFGTISRVPQEYMSLNGGYENTGRGLCGCGARPYSPVNKLLYEYQLLQPSQPKAVVDGLSARVLRNQQNRLQNRLLPFQGSTGFGLSGGCVKESGGTGVFIPRILNTSATTSAVASDTRKRKVLRNEQETQVTGNSLKGIDVAKQRESHYYLPPEMSLPQDWTY